MQSTIQTSQEQIFPNEEGESTYSPEGSLASPSVWPDKEKERMIKLYAGQPIPSFDEILEANRDVLERIKEKGD